MTDEANDADITRCLNCGAELTGPYCAACGQRDDRHLHSLRHFLGEAFEGLTHADSRLWRTLWLLLARPGFLTREFFAGRRQRYLPPFRLYIVVSLVFFLVLALLPDSGIVRVDVMPPDEAASVDARIAKIVAEEAATRDPDRQAALAVARRSLEAMRAREGERGSSQAPQSSPEMYCDALSYQGPGEAWLQPRLELGCRKSVADKGALGRAFLHNVPRAMFFLLPLIAAFMLLIYWRPRRYYVEHLLFYIHNHAMIFLLGIVLAPVFWLLPGTVAPALLAAAVSLWLLWYLFRAMRVYYGQGRRRTFLKFLFMGNVYLVLGFVMLVFTLLYSVATL
ncbi:MAG: hypothetical protein CMLOHMNK_03732 [Steroidobacteraceae bacterium]|nr:hypothetical protein [Steroidobacteraceae bacterium]